MTVSGQNFELHQGDRRNVTITVYDDDGNVLDLTAYTTIIWVVYRQTNKQEILRKELGDGITVSSPASGQLLIELLPEDTENVIPAQYNHECEISSSPTNVHTVTTGTIKILYSKV